MMSFTPQIPSPSTVAYRAMDTTLCNSSCSSELFQKYVFPLAIIFFSFLFYHAFPNALVIALSLNLSSSPYSCHYEDDLQSGQPNGVFFSPFFFSIILFWVPSDIDTVPALEFKTPIKLSVSFHMAPS